MRPRYSVAGGKSDGFDSFVLAELARTDSHRFRVLVPDSDQTKALRVADARAGGSRPHPDRARQPAARSARVFLAGGRQRVLRGRLTDRAGVSAPLSQPADARGLGEQRLARSSSATATPAANPPASCSSGCGAARRAAPASSSPQARRQIVLALVSALEPIVERISELTIEIRHALDAHPDGATFRSLFIATDSWLCAATMLAEIGDCRERYPSYRALAADAGQAPVAVESGKSRHAKFRWACDHRLREAFDSSPTPAATTTPGPPTSTPRPSPRRRPRPRHPHPRTRLEPGHLAPLARPRHLRPLQHTALQSLIAAGG